MPSIFGSDIPSSIPSAKSPDTGANFSMDSSNLPNTTGLIDTPLWIQEQQSQLNLSDSQQALEKSIQAQVLGMGLNPDGGTSNNTDPKETSEVASSTPLPTPGSSPCVTFPAITIPSFSLPVINLPRISLPSLPSCLDPNFPGAYPTTVPQTAKDVTLPKATPATGTTNTVVSTPTYPQAISREIALVAPSVASNLVPNFGSALLLAANTTGRFLSGLAGMIASKAEALSNTVLADVASGIQGTLNGIGNAEDFAGTMANGLGSWANQAMAMVPATQIIIGFHNTASDKLPQLALSSDAITQASRMADGTPKTSQNFVNNAVMLTKDYHNTAAGQDLASKAVGCIASAASAISQGLGRLAMCAHLDGMTWMMAIHPFHISLGGAAKLPHTWKFDCHNLTNSIGQVFNTLGSVTSEVLGIQGGGTTGAMPGNLLHAAFGESPVSLSSSNIALTLPLLIAASLGSPFTSLINTYLTDPGAQHDNLTPQVPSLLMAGNPQLAKLLTALKALATLIMQLNALTTVQMTQLQNGVTEIGGATLTFIQNVKSQSPLLGPINKLANDLLANRLSATQESTLTALATQWDDLSTSLVLSAVQDVSLRILVAPIITSRQGLFGAGERMDSLLSTTVSDRNTFGGPTGMELVYITAIFAALLRILMMLHTPEISDTEYIIRSKGIMTDAADHGSQVTNGAPYVNYVTALASSMAMSGTSIGSAVVASMPSAVSAVQATTAHQHTQASLINELTAQQRGGNSHSTQEAANQINHVRETTDTHAYIAGALDNHSSSIKKTITTSIAGVGGSAKVASDAGFSDQLGARSDDVKTVVQETSNALASTTMLKATGAKLNQQYEGVINQSKFMLNQAGTSYGVEAPFIRHAGRIVTQQGRLILTEGDTVDTRAQWVHTHAGDWGVMSQNNSFINTNKELTLSGNVINMYGQSGTLIADKGKVRLNSGNGSQVTLDGGTAGIKGLNVTMTAEGNIVIAATTTITLQVGGIGITISSAGISLAPPGLSVLGSAPLDTVSPVNPVVPNFTKTPDQVAVALPARGNRNPIPCVAPYKKS